MGLRTRLTLGLLVAGVAATGYAAGIERTWWTLRHVTVPVLPPGAPPLRVLHLSDLHLLPQQQSKQDWIRRLDAVEPHLVVLTGDVIAHPLAVPYVVHALGPLLDRPGFFVLGNNDYYAPVPKNPLSYFLPERRHRHRPTAAALPWEALRDALVACGWRDMDNARTTVDVGGRWVEVSGVDDPMLGRDDYDAVAGPVDPAAEVHLGLVHSPEPRLLDRFATDGVDLLLSGHTHGGQLRVPFYGALVTNCGIDRGRARWLSRYADGSWLHVSAGLGTSPYAPVRFACPPEATLLTLIPRAADGRGPID